MDEVLRNLKRSADTGDVGALRHYAAHLERIVGGVQPSNSLQDILDDLLEGYLHDDGVPSSTDTATIHLIALLFGEEKANLIRLLVDAGDGKFFFEEAGEDGCDNFWEACQILELNHRVRIVNDDRDVHLSNCNCGNCNDQKVSHGASIRDINNGIMERVWATSQDGARGHAIWVAEQRGLKPFRP